jgi:hypothetical protein
MKVLSRYFAAIAVSMMLTSGLSAGLLTEWNYNAETNIGDASTGTGTTTGGGSFPFTNTLPNSNGSSADPGTVITQGLNNQEWTRRGPNAGEPSGDRSVTWATSTAGTTDIKLTWDMVAGYRTSRYYQISAATDGTTFVPVSGGIGAGSATPGVGFATVNSVGLITVMLDDGFEPDPSLDPVVPIDYLFDLSYAFPSGSAYENNPNFAVQIAAVHAPGGSDFVSSFAGTTSADAVSGYARSGGNDTRYDLVRISGIPEPTSIGLAVCGLALMYIGRRS